MTGIDRIRAERQRQLEVEGHSTEHDMGHGSAELVQAAIAYALGSDVGLLRSGRRNGVPGPRTWWPWEPEALKLTPTDRIRELAKAGALLAAAIDVELHDQDPT